MALVGTRFFLSGEARLLACETLSHYSLSRPRVFDQFDDGSDQSPKPGCALALVNASRSLLLSCNVTALIVSSSCSMPVALAIAPVIPGWAISQARATAAGVV